MGDNYGMEICAWFYSTTTMHASVTGYGCCWCGGGGKGGGGEGGGGGGEEGGEEVRRREEGRN